MDLGEKITGYLLEAYNPYAIILYGSFADGSANESSDFDALVITDHIKKHDASIIEGTVLDVFVYPLEVFQTDYNPEEFVQVFDGKIVLDKNGAAERLKQRVLDYIADTPQKSIDELKQELEWCEKMLSRTLREDVEGYYRWHWVLFDSLEIYYDLNYMHYYGPKKALRLMESTDTEAYQIYSRALKEFNREYLSEWICYLKHLI